MCTPLEFMSIVNPLDTRAYWPFQGGASFLDPFCYLCFILVFVVPSCLFLAALWSAAERGWPLGSCVCVCVCVCCFVFRFPKWCPGSSVVLGCIIWFLAFSLLWKKAICIMYWRASKDLDDPAHTHIDASVFTLYLGLARGVFTVSVYLFTCLDKAIIKLLLINKYGEKMKSYQQTES